MMTAGADGGTVGPLSNLEWWHMRRLRQALALTVFVILLVAFAVPLAYANTESGYVTWTAGVPNDTPPLTPHAGYATTTQKCAVCHAVHKAPADGELLLRGTAAESCTYCHIQTEIGITVIYGGVLANYTTEDDHGHQSPAVTCIDCHAVHGANTFKGDATVKILKVWNIQETFVEYITQGSTDTSGIINGVGPLDPAENNGYSWPDWWGPKDVVDAAFCTQCHPYYSGASEDTVTAGITLSDGSIETTSFKTHPLKMPGGEQIDASGTVNYYRGFVAQGSTVPTDQSVAVYSTRGCYWTCHRSENGRDPNPNVDPPYNVFINNYPHYNPNTARFLTSGENREGPVARSSDDSNCLMCHLWPEDAGGHGYNDEGAFPTSGGVGVHY
jgi:predicted CXXCH cytochrome family protein